MARVVRPTRGLVGAGRVGDTPRVAAVGVHEIDLESFATPVDDVGNGLAVGRPHGVVGAAALVGETPHVTTGDVHGVDLRLSGAVADEGDLGAVGTEGGRRVARAVVGDPAFTGAVGVLDVDLGVAVFAKHEGETGTVWRPRGGGVKPDVLGQRRRFPRRQVEDIQEGVAVLVGEIGDLASVGGEFGLDRNGVVPGDLLGVVAVVVGDEDLLLAIGGAGAETDLGGGDAGDAVDAADDLFGKTVGDKTRQVAPGGEALADNLRTGDHIEHAELGDDRLALHRHVGVHKVVGLRGLPGAEVELCGVRREPGEIRRVALAWQRGKESREHEVVGQCGGHFGGDGGQLR